MIVSAVMSLSMSARMQIANTAQTKAAFHHGSTVPYGSGVTTIRMTSATNISLFSNFELFVAKFGYLAFSAVIAIAAGATGSSSRVKIRAAAFVNSRRNKSAR